MSGIATAIVGTAYLSSEASSDASDAAIESNENLTQAQIKENARQHDAARADTAPYRQIGSDFMPDLRRFMRGDYSNFLNSPDYNFTFEQGQRAVMANQSANQSRYGGRALKEAAQFGQGLASTQIDKYFSRLFNTVNIGASAAAGTAQGGMQLAGLNSNLIGNMANSNANLTMQGAAAQSNAINSAVGNLTTLQMYNNMMPKA